MRRIEGNFKGLKNFNIYYQSWLPDKKIKAVLLIAHGFAERSGRYANVVKYFVPDEIFNEPEHPMVLADLETWLKAHT
jgi:hypothetical protein